MSAVISELNNPMSWGNNQLFCTAFLTALPPPVAPAKWRVPAGKPAKANPGLVLECNRRMPLVGLLARLASLSVVWPRCSRAGRVVGGGWWWV